MRQFQLYVVLCFAFLLYACSSPLDDSSMCIELCPVPSFDEGFIESAVDLEEDSIVITVGDRSVSYPRVPAVDDFRGRVFDGIASVLIDKQEDGAVVELYADDGDLVVHAGIVNGVPNGILTATAASLDAPDGGNSLCTANPDVGRFVGVEFRTVDDPVVLAAGVEQVLALGQQDYVAGVPWAFVTSENTFSGWAYLVRLE